MRSRSETRMTVDALVAAPTNDSGVLGARPLRFLSHLPALDGLRGVAILLVLAHNFATVPLPPTLMGRMVEEALDLGWIGVQLFFVLSGFLITRILLQTQGASNYYSSFFGRRVLRIFPLYYGALFVALVVFPLFGAVSPVLAHDQAHQIWLWLYLSNWAQLLNFDSHVFPHFWSLAIEEQFYLLWPLLVRRRDGRQVLRLCLTIAMVSFVVRVTMLWQGASPESVYTNTVCRMDALALGAAVAAWLHLPGVAERIFAKRQWLAWSSLALFAVGLVATHGYPRTLPMGQTLGYSWLACVFALIVLAAASGGEPGPEPPWIRVLTAVPLRSLGRYSYGMYVFHKPLHDWIGRPLLLHFGLLKQPSHWVALGYVLVAALATLIVAMMSYHVFEAHVLALRRWFVSEAAPAPGSAEPSLAQVRTSVPQTGRAS